MSNDSPPQEEPAPEDPESTLETVQKQVEEFKREAERWKSRAEVATQAAADSQTYARDITAKVSTLENLYAQVIDKVEGIFKAVPDNARTALRISMAAYTATKNLDDAIALQNKKTNWVPIILAIFAGSLLLLIIANPTYAIPVGNFITTPIGGIVAALVLILCIAAVWKML